MKKEKTVIRGHQGDVEFKMIDSIPITAKRTDNTPLAYGEVSGHVHVLTGEVECFEDNGRRFARIKGDGARLQHIHESNLKSEFLIETKELPAMDHKSILLPPGIYEFGIQKQYDPFEEVFKQVQD